MRWTCTTSLEGSLTDDWLGFIEQALHEALMRQEDLLAYIDSQEEAKFRVSLFNQ